MAGSRAKHSAGLTALVFAVPLVLRLILVGVYGPVHHPDSGGYIAYADLILGDNRWLHSADLFSDVAPITALRAIGYPAIIALAKILAGERFDYLLVHIQSAFTLLAALALHRLALRLELGIWPARLTVFLYLSSHVLVYDLSVLSDSLFASLFIFLVAGLSLAILDRGAAAAARLVGFGTIFAAAMLVREATPYFAVLLVPAVAAWSWQARRSWRHALVAIVWFLLPLVLVLQGYRAWNDYRTGTAFFTTGGQFTMLMPLLSVAERKPELLPADEPLGVAAREARAPIVFHRAVETNVLLHRRYGLTAPQLSALAWTQYVRAFGAAPLSFLAYAAGQYRVKHTFLFVNFYRAPLDVVELATGLGQPGPTARLSEFRAQPSLSALVAISVEYSLRAASMALFVLFALGVPIMLVRALWRAGRLRPEDALLGWFWLLYWGVTGIYSLFHLELRYTLPVQAVAILAGLAVGARMRTPLRPSNALPFAGRRR